MRNHSEISYLAGIIDGEGCLSIQLSGGTYRTTIQVASTSQELIDWLHKTFSGGRSYRPESESTEENFIWVMASKPAIVKLLSVVIGELKIKRLPAIILLDFCKTFNVGKHRRYSDAQYESMGEYHRLMMLANSKGPGSNARKSSLLRLVQGAQK